MRLIEIGQCNLYLVLADVDAGVSKTVGQIMAEPLKLIGMRGRAELM